METLPSNAYALTTTYLNTASHGLLPAPTVAALREATAEMADGRMSVPLFLERAERARSGYAALTGVTPDRVALGSSVAGHAALVAASLPPGAEVVAPEEDFASVVTPFEQRGGLRLRLVPLEKLADAVRPETALVAFSAVQSADGRIADLDAVRAAAREHGARTMADLTQAGWMPLSAGDFDFTVCGAYKWLLCPRGVSFLTVPEDFGGLRPVNAGWVAGEDPWASCYGPVAELARTARRFDDCPAFLPYAGAVPSLEFLRGLGPASVREHDLALAARFRAGLARLGVEPVPGDSAIVSVPGLGGATARLADAGIVAASRAGHLRVSFHLYNTEADVDRLLNVLEAPAPEAEQNFDTGR
ncbi:aminotransferase class V-fold PLP-dependent enzyme [Streptomyces aidingensis]|uniref:Selenocysteine lyase/Cysteine desulfurase n=1 Tax=Streptomyces aidingensis TaxID=910347 RepID=A0A1I1JBI7_9ACTN|nr:aminotransferase class V-fold PLP-dependent enzyme [Streptomyces aidingensis]SFC45352.1 Selenocysteine lyase/Cysteine desulfurase [Streptomyces aidingensis]